MILDMEDGREIRLPDEVSDEFARALKQLILTNEARARDAEARAETRARDAEARVARLERDLHALIARPGPQPLDITPILAALRANHSEQMAALKALERAIRADRVMVMDEFGEYTRSRIG